MKLNLPNTPAWTAYALVALGLGFSPYNATAQDFYVGLGIGQSKVDSAECSPEIQAAFFDISCSADDTDTAFRVFGGYRIPTASGSPISAAIELGYIDFGEASISGVDSFYGISRITASPKGFNFSIIGSVDVTDRLSLLGRVGFLRWDSEFENIDQIESFSEDSSGTDFAFGIGASLALTDQIEGRIEWERFEIDDDDVDLVSASIIFRF